MAPIGCLLAGTEREFLYGRRCSLVALLSPGCRLVIARPIGAHLTGVSLERMACCLWPLRQSRGEVDCQTARRTTCDCESAKGTCLGAPPLDSVLSPTFIHPLSTLMIIRRVLFFLDSY